MHETTVVPPPVIADAEALPAGSTNAVGRVTVHAPCVGCGYDLRSQPAAGNCPECGLPVNASLKHAFLSFAHPRATRMLVAGSATLIVMGVVYGLTVLAMFVGGPIADILDIWWFRMQIGADLFVHLLLLVSTVLLTWRTSVRDTAGWTALRWCVRGLMLVAFCTAAAWSSWIYGVMLGTADWNMHAWFYYPYVTADVISYSLLVWYRRKLALRTASTSLSRWILALFGLTIFVAVVDYAVWPVQIALFGLPLIGVSYAIYFFGLAVHLFDFILMIAQHRTLRWAHHRARENWTIRQRV